MIKEEIFVYTYNLISPYPHQSSCPPLPSHCPFFLQIDLISLFSTVAFEFPDRKQGILEWDRGILNSNVSSDTSSFMDVRCSQRSY